MLPGVTVTLTSGALQANRVTITGENGGYLFALLPPADYVLRFDLQGFATAEQRARVTLAGTTRVDVELRPAPLQESVTVVSDRTPLAASTSIVTNVSASELQRLPAARDIRGAVLLSPSASALGPRGRLVIAGGSSFDSLFLVDGVVVNENLTGQPHD